MFDISAILGNLLNPAILFFLLGMVAVFIKSDLSIPQPVSRFLSYYLLFSIGLKGGMELAENAGDSHMYALLGIALGLSILVPIYTFFILRAKLDIYNAGAIAATYGSISAVTFVTAIDFLRSNDIEYNGYMVAAMALMEAPAIIAGLILINMQNKTGSRRKTMAFAMREAFTNGSIVLILGSLLIGAIADHDKLVAMTPFTNDIFKGILALFLLDMGLVAGKRLGAIRQSGPFLIIFAILIPLLNAAVTILLVEALNVELGNALLLTVLSASASYIAVPAAMRVTVPKANPGIYVPMSLAITFPLNIVLGIPVYFTVLNYFT
ncbi:MAG: sodium-dependent bicarbonate transport family permease [Roseivirga sp.]